MASYSLYLVCRQTNVLPISLGHLFGIMSKLQLC